MNCEPTSKYSLETRLIIASIMPMAVTLALTIFFVICFSLYATLLEEQEHALAIARVLAQNLDSALLSGNEGEIFGILMLHSRLPHAEKAAAYLGSGRWVMLDPLSTHIPASATLSTQESTDYSLEHVHYAVPVMHNGAPIGTVVLQTSMHPILLGLAKVAAFCTAAYLITIAFAYFLARRFAKSLTVPVRHLLSTVREVSSLETFTLRAAPLRWHRHKIDEIEALAEQFDLMLEHVERRDDKLAEINRSLERIVESRTSELANEKVKGIEAARLASVGEMASGIAHEINNPLAAIRAGAEAIIAGVDAGETNPELLRKQAKRIVTVTDRISKIIHGLKTFARNGEKDPMHETPIGQIILETVEFCQSRFKNHGVDLRLPVVPDDLSAKCRSVQISQVLLNLLNNAFDALLADSKPDKWVEVEVKRAGDSVEIHVVDNGPGVAPEFKEKIMQPFFTTKGVGKGTGLGLSISRTIMHEHGGTLTLETDGTTRFIITLPVQGPAEAQAEVGADQETDAA